MWYSHLLVGSCVELLGVNLAIDTYGVSVVCASPGLVCNGGVCVPDPSLPCGTTTMWGGPIQYAPDQCYLPLPFNDSYYDFLWCQSVAINIGNGPIGVETPCQSDPDIIAGSDAPYGVRVNWAEIACPIEFREWNFCAVENVCTAQDKLNGDCTCTADEQANNECTP